MKVIVVLNRETLVSLLVSIALPTGVLVSMIMHCVRAAYPTHESAHPAVNKRPESPVITRLLLLFAGPPEIRKDDYYYHGPDNPEWMRHSIFTSIAYGAKGIQWFHGKHIFAGDHLRPNGKDVAAINAKDPFRNNWPIYGELWRRLDGVRLHRRIDQYACFAFLASLVLAAPKSATYS